MSYAEFGRRRSWANAVMAAACLFLISCATPVDESAAKVETQSASLQSETWQLECKKKFNGPSRLHPLDLVIGFPVCVVKDMAAAVVLVGALAAVIAILPPLLIAEWASKQWPASDTEEKEIPSESEAH